MQVEHGKHNEVKYEGPSHIPTVKVFDAACKKLNIFDARKCNHPESPIINIPPPFYWMVRKEDNSHRRINDESINNIHYFMNNNIRLEFP